MPSISGTSWVQRSRPSNDNVNDERPSACHTPRSTLKQLLAKEEMKKHGVCALVANDNNQGNATSIIGDWRHSFPEPNAGVAPQKNKLGQFLMVEVGEDEHHAPGNYEPMRFLPCFFIKKKLTFLGEILMTRWGHPPLMTPQGELDTF